jgi:hypothetical protein
MVMSDNISVNTIQSEHSDTNSAEGEFDDYPIYSDEESVEEENEDPLNPLTEEGIFTPTEPEIPQATVIPDSSSVDLSKVDNTMQEDFQKYVDGWKSNFIGLNPQEKAGIELMDMLIKMRAPLNMYEKVFKWHEDNLECEKSLSRKVLLKELDARYNGAGRRPKMSKKMTLPHSRARVQLAEADPLHQLVSMLTDPRVNDDDYWFWDKDPFKQPPPEDEQNGFVGDIHTGRAHRETWKKLVKDPKKDIPWPIIVYVDAAVTAQNNGMPVEALKLTNGLLRREARDRPYGSRKIGYLPNYLGEKSAGHRIIAEDGGVDAQNYISEDEDGDEPDVPVDPKAPKWEKPVKAQDMHTMISHILERFRKLQEGGGFWWNFRYNGETLPVRFIPYVMFMKGDTVEHDKHCGQYTSRTEGVSMLCRYCQCPSAQMDEPFLNFPPKCPKLINKIRNSGKHRRYIRELLKDLSQQDIDNAWYAIIFALHDERGIHGAALLEILHWIQLGKFKSIRELFFSQ